MREELSDTPISPVQIGNTIMDTITAQATSHIQAFSQATAQLDMS